MPEMSERIAELRRELESNPLSRQFYQLGELLRRDGRAAEAITVLRGGLGHHPRYVAAWVSLGRACLDRTEPKAAADALHEALELDAQNPVAWRLLGEARLGGGDRFGALDAMQHALQLAPGDEVLRAAVDALASETWPPEPAPVSTKAAALEATQPLAVAAPRPAAPAEPPVTAAAVLAVVPPLPASLVEAKRGHPPAAAAPAAVSTLAAPAPLAPLALDLGDPFALPMAEVAVEASADVFAVAGEASSFADEPFGVGAPAAAPAFLAEYAPPTEGVSTPHATAAGLEPFAERIAAAAPSVDAFAAAPPAAAPLAEAAQVTAPIAELLEEPPPRSLPSSAPLESAPAIEELVRPAPAEPTVSPREAAAAAARPTLTLARLHLQQQDFPAAITIPQRLVTSDTDNQEARDLLELVHDMMAPLPGELPLASVRERKIAALQGWLASLTLGQERVNQ